jgi:NAD(P)-dependent dehydrogenase (short-subunit alcohol dehydrogenase family)
VRKRHGARSSEAAGVLIRLAEVHQALGQYDRSDQLPWEALGINHAFRGEYAEGIAVLREALDMRRRVLGQEHPLIAGNAASLAYWLIGEREFDEASRLVEEGLSIRADAARLTDAAILSVPGKDHTMRNLALVSLLAFAVPGITATADAGPSVAPQRAVLVTGASSGIGRKITERLAAEGYFVYAGARKEKDLRDLDAIENVESIRLDVTSPQEIAAAVETVRKAGRGLHGLVNNAGVAVVGPLMEAKEDDLRFVFDVNVFGPYRVTKAFAPLILESGGRIITISSIAGILSRPPLGAYSMSKHAIEAFGDALAEELEPRGVKVSLIEPGNYRSEISRNAAVRMGLGPDAQMADRSRFKEPDEVAEAVLHALFDANPKRRYLVVPDAREAEMTITKAIEELVQLNERQPFSYDRDELVKMLDAALGRK